MREGMRGASPLTTIHEDIVYSSERACPSHAFPHAFSHNIIPYPIHVFLQSTWLNQSPLIMLSALILGLLCVLLIILLVNLLTFRRLRPHLTGEKSAYGQLQAHETEPDRSAPLVSILIPARDEEHCIEACVCSLLEQTYEPLEVLVLDDHSSDATARIVQGIQEKSFYYKKSRLRLLKGAALPQGWNGKNYACHQLAQHAQGDYLLFTDADTTHEPTTVQAVIDCMRAFNVSLLTAQPEFELESMGERMVVPLLNFTIMTLLPIPLILLRSEPSLATGNGQLLCFQRQAYEKIGGHASVKNRILEDVLLARAFKTAGYRMLFVDAFDLVRCRMYRSFSEVWAGFSKNLFAFYNYSLPFALVALLLNLLLFVYPPLLVLIAPLTHPPVAALVCSALAYLLAVFMRVLLTLRFTRSQRGLMLLLCLLHPLSIVLECLILLNSIRWRYRKTGTAWKGRHYTFSSDRTVSQD